MPDQPIETTPAQSSEEATDPSNQLPLEPDQSMQEYFRLQQELLVATICITGVVFICVWIVYSLNTALNYVIGACTGVVYLRLLAKNVEQLGRQRSQVGNTRLALVIGLVVIASRLNQLEILPVFLGFLTYKAALVVYVLRTVMLPNSN